MILNIGPLRFPRWREAEGVERAVKGKGRGGGSGRDGINCDPYREALDSNGFRPFAGNLAKW